MDGRMHGVVDSVTGVTLHEGNPSAIPASLLGGEASAADPLGGVPSATPPSMIHGLAGDFNAGNAPSTPEPTFAPPPQGPVGYPGGPQYAQQQQAPQGYAPQQQQPPQQEAQGAPDPFTQLYWEAYGLQGKVQQYEQELEPYRQLEERIRQHPHLQQAMYDMLVNPQKYLPGAQAPQQAPQADPAVAPQAQQPQAQAPIFQTHGTGGLTIQEQARINQLEATLGRMAALQELDRLERSHQDFNRKAVTVYAQRHGMPYEEAYYALRGRYYAQAPQAPQALQQVQYVPQVQQPQQAPQGWSFPAVAGQPINAAMQHPPRVEAPRGYVSGVPAGSAAPVGGRLAAPTQRPRDYNEAVEMAVAEWQG